MELICAKTAFLRLWFFL